MQSPIWAECAARAFYADHDVAIMHAGAESQPKVIAPLGKLRSEVLWRYEILGAEKLGEPVDLLYESADELRDFLDGFYKLGIPLFIKRMLADSPTLDVLTDEYSTRCLFFSRPAGATPWLSFDDGAKDPEARFDSGRRSDFRRAMRKAGTFGKVEVDVSLPAEDDLDRLLDDALEVESAGWKGREGSALRYDQARHQFFRDYALAACRLGQLRMGFLRIDGKAAAMMIAVEQSKRLWLLKVGYDEKFKTCSPGVLLLMEGVRAAMSNGLEGVEFLGTEAPWTKVWTQVTRPCIAFRAYPARPRGLATLAADAAMRSGERLMQRYRPWG